MTKLIIDRDRWHRGHGSGQSYLMRQDGKMCCLGFYGLQCGYTPAEITKLSTPMDAAMAFELRPGFEGLVQRPRGADDQSYINSDVAGQLMNLNDSTGLEESTREISLKATFATLDIEVEFIGGDS